MHQVPNFVAARITQPAIYKGISEGSTPVPFFGNIEAAKIATLSLNPSHNEFYIPGSARKNTKERLRLGADKRLESLTSLGVHSLESLSASQVNSVYEKCLCYFDKSGNPYKGWFNRIDGILQAGLGVSYYHGTCCHLDIVQWATNPKWNGLNDAVRNQMLADDLPFLMRLLSHYDVELVLMNGRTAITKFQEAFAAEINTV